MFGFGWAKNLAKRKSEDVYGSMRAKTVKVVEGAKAMNEPITDQQRRFQLARLMLYLAAILSFGVMFFVGQLTTYWVFVIYLGVVLFFFWVHLDRLVAADLAKWFYRRERGGAGWELDPVRDRALIEEESERRLLDIWRVLKAWEVNSANQRRKQAPEILVEVNTLGVSRRYGLGSEAPKGKDESGPEPETEA